MEPRTQVVEPYQEIATQLPSVMVLALYVGMQRSSARKSAEVAESSIGDVTATGSENCGDRTKGRQSSGDRAKGPNAPLSLKEPVSVLPRRGDADACSSLAVDSVPSRSLGDSHHDLQRKQRLGSSSPLCTVPASDCERTMPAMLSDAEESLTDTDKADAVAASSNPNATRLPITVGANDQPLGKGMEEDSTAFNNVPNTAEEDAYNVACWKVVRNKRRARNAAALEAASPLPTDSENPRAKPRPTNAPLSLKELVSVLPRRGDADACGFLAVDSVSSRSLGDSHHDLQRKQRLRSSSPLCTVPASDCERTTPAMLSDAEESLTDTDKADAVVASSNPNATSLPITVRTNDQPHRKGIDEDSTAFNNVPNTAEEDAYNVACWKVVRNKRLARNAAALEAASPLPTDSENPRAEPRPSVAHRLPPLPFRYEKLVLRPFGGLRLDLWPRQTLATALWATARVSPNDRRNLILRTRPEQNLAVLSTLSLHVTDAPLKLQELSLGQRTYPVSAYLAASGDSCEEYLVLEPGTTSHRLVEELQATRIQILQARVMGQTNIALVTFEALRVPRFVCFHEAELRCHPPPRPQHQVCKTCLKSEHQADYHPTPDITVSAVRRR
ncbi:hypothetical protein HPB51_013520 [Rhipicephalus microplus]|uniref:Uncharacterized protein n=1 Tax=Rhipicephalus microplus TaxID=6941 RepID=A0A9J6E1L7_RHIMP|nr:hypothetical protein HPB51_013520 [Rhipicephalus microplus]